MSVYAISDLHLSLAKPKPMDIFGDVWENHADKIKENWDSLVKDEDIILLPGDLSWAMHFDEARKDLEFIADLPGHKVMIRGNHDYWWQRRATNRIQNEINREMIFLQGASTVIDNIGITGTRGWRVDLEMSGIHDSKSIDEVQSARIFRRELNYLERGLQSIPNSVRLKIVMLHYPPFDENLQPNEFATLLKEYSADILVYGHIHKGLGMWIEGEVDGIQYFLVSADMADFTPRFITD